jgi:hypothetical protein
VDVRLGRLAYEPPIGNTFLSEQISHRQLAHQYFLLEQTSHQQYFSLRTNQPPAILFSQNKPAPASKAR